MIQDSQSQFAVRTTHREEFCSPTKCTGCSVLDQLAGDCGPHGGLQLHASEQRHTRGLGVIVWDHYRCGVCGCLWVHQSDDLGQYWFEE